MKTFDFTVKDELGIHARPAGLIVKEFAPYKDTKITIKKGEKSADIKRLMAVMSLGVKCGETITVEIDGADEDKIETHLKEFLEKNL